MGEGQVGRPVKPVPAGDQYNKHTIKMLDSTWKQLRILAACEDTNISDLLEKITKEYAEKQK
jgi:hypothetical protein